MSTAKYLPTFRSIVLSSSSGSSNPGSPPLFDYLTLNMKAVRSCETSVPTCRRDGQIAEHLNLQHRFNNLKCRIYLSFRRGLRVTERYTDCMEQSPFCEADCSSAGQNVSRSLWNMKGHHFTRSCQQTR